MKRLLLLLVFLPVRGFSPVLFDGVNDMVGFGACGDSMLREQGQTYTISALIMPLTLGESSLGTIVRRGALQFRLNNSDEITMRIAGSTTLMSTCVAGCIVTNTWSHVLVTGDGTTNFTGIHIYVNGAEISYGSTANGVTLTDNSADPIIIGNNDAGTVSFNGQISEVAVWTSVLTAAQIAALYNGRGVHGTPLQTSFSTLQAYWPLDDFGDGTALSGTGTVHDRSVNAFNGSQTNGPIGKASSIVSYP